MPPEYALDDFINACRTGKARPSKSARRDASLYFQLHTEEQLLLFIASNGLENPTFINSRELDKWPGPPPAPVVDAYTFFSGPQKGYIAFFLSPKWYWILKSFHNNNHEGEINLKSNPKIL